MLVWATLEPMGERAAEQLGERQPAYHLPSRTNLDVGGVATRRWNLGPRQLDPFEMVFDSRPHPLLDVPATRSGRRTSREIWRVGRVAGFRLLGDDEVSLHGWSLSPACLRMLLRVPGASSSLILPAIVTTRRTAAALECDGSTL